VIGVRHSAREGPEMTTGADESYDQMLWTALKKKAAYLPG
jgi:hypothetical protein